MICSNTISQIRSDSIGINLTAGDRQAVIVLTNYAVDRCQYGVQFWTREMINARSSKNTDHSVSNFVEML